MKRSLSLLLLLFILLPGVSLASSDSGYRVAPLPAWVDEHELPPLPDPAAGYPADIVFRDLQQRLGADPARYFRHVVRPLTAAGVPLASSPSIAFNPAFQRLELHRLLIWRKGKPRDVTSSVRTRLLQREEALDSGIQDGRVTVLMSPDDVQVGDLVDLAYSIHGLNPIFSKESGTLSLNDAVPVHELRLRLLGGTKPLQLRADSGQLPLTPVKRSGRTEYQALLRDVPAVHAESAAPSWDNGSHWLQYSEYRDWQDVATWGEELYRVPAGKTPAFDALYARLAAAATSPEDFVSRALHYTQEEIRYLGLEFGENSHRPNPPESVITRKFGDCKDKALLLASLLRQHGIPAEPALVATDFRDGLAKVLADPGFFDHVILHVQLAGQTYWLDGTLQGQGGRLETLGRSDFGYALVLERASTGLTRMYTASVPPLVAEVEEHYYVDDFSRPVRLQVQTRRYGNAAESFRDSLDNVPVEVLQKQQLEFYRRYYDEILSTALLRFEDDRANNVLTMREEYEIPGFWQREAGRLRADFFVSAFDGLIEQPAETERKTPLLLSLPRQVRGRIYVHFPDKVGISPEPGEVKVEGGAFEYRAQQRYEGATYVLESTLGINRYIVSPAEFPRFLAATRTFRKATRIPLSFSYPEQARRQRQAKPVKGKTRK